MPSTPADAPARPLAGAAERSKYLAQQRRADVAREFGSIARALLHLAARVTGASGPDALRAIIGREDTVALLRAAGMDIEGVTSRWAADDPAPRQVSTGPDYRDGWEYDPRLLKALDDRVPMGEYAQLSQQVKAEWVARAGAEAAARAARERPTDTAIPGVSYGEGSVPVQRGGPGNTDRAWDPISHTFRSAAAAPDPWAAYPDHQPGFMARISAAAPSLGGGGMLTPGYGSGPVAVKPAPDYGFEPDPASAVEVPPMATDTGPGPGDCPACGASGYSGARFCTECGAGLT